MNAQTKEAARVEAAQRESVRSRTALVKSSQALAKYGSPQELAEMVTRFKFMLPGGDKMDDDAVYGLAQASFLYGLDPFLKEIFWIDGPAPGIRGIRRKGREWAKDQGLGIPDLRYEQIPEDEFVALEIPPGSLAYRTIGGFPAKLDAHAKRMGQIREALGPDAPYQVILDQAGPRPEIVGYGYLTREEIYDKDHPLWWHICEKAENNTARRKTWQPKSNGDGNYYGWAEVYELRARECPDCGEKSWKEPSSYSHVQHAQKRAEAHWYKLACDLPFQLGPGNAPPGEGYELRGDEGITFDAPDLTGVNDEIAQMARDQGWSLDELNDYLAMRRDAEIQDAEFRDLSPDERAARAAEANDTLYGSDGASASVKKASPRSRPFPAETVRSKVAKTVEDNKGARRDAKIGTMEAWQYARWQLSECFTGRVNDREELDRMVHSVSAYLFGKDTATDWTGAEALAIVKWLDPKPNDAGDLKPSADAKIEAMFIWKARMKELGIEELPGLDGEQ